jgi:hypothetical protein
MDAPTFNGIEMCQSGDVDQPLEPRGASIPLLTFDPAQATEVQSAGDVTIKLQRVQVDGDKGEMLLYCHSPAREEKDRAIDTAKASGLEAALVKLQAGLAKPKVKTSTQDVATFMQRLGRAKQRFARAAL